MFLFSLQGKFLAFYQFAKTFNSDNFNYSQLDNLDFVFMRWKVNELIAQTQHKIIGIINRAEYTGWPMNSWQISKSQFFHL